MVAGTGEPFCPACKRTTKLLIRHNLDGVMVRPCCWPSLSV
eukprot:SAG22_NODE_8175_length_677_cov_1.200692_1_plen_40_part_10